MWDDDRLVVHEMIYNKLVGRCKGFNCLDAYTIVSGPGRTHCFNPRLVTERRTYLEIGVPV